MPKSFTRGYKGSARKFGIISLTALIAATASSCGLSPASSGAGDNTLTVVTWKGYGADEPWAVAEFEKETGAKIRFQYVDSEASMLQLVDRANGGIDVALPNLQFLQPGVQQGVFAPLDEGRLSNYKNIFPDLTSNTALRSGGDLYGVPWVWGESGIFYDAATVRKTPTSWSDLWDPSYKGKVGLYDDSTILAPIAGMHLGEDPSDPDISKVGPALTALAGDSKLVFSSNDDLAKAVSNGSVSIGVVDSGAVGSLALSGIGDLKFALPKEGGIGWVDNWAIAAKSKHKDLAYKWLNYMTSPEFLSRWANDPAGAAPTPANAVAVSQLTPGARQRLQTDPAQLHELHLQLPLPTERLQRWADAWQTAKAG